MRAKGVTPPSYKGRRPASERASAAARGASKKKDTTCESLVRQRLWAAGLRFRKNYSGLPGCPDIVFTRPKLAIFCDGDFWHGKDWKVRRRKLGRGTNSDYWLAKIKRNIERDRKTTRQLQEMGWKVMRFWESQILADPSGVAQEILGALDERSPGDDLLKGS